MISKNKEHIKKLNNLYNNLFKIKPYKMKDFKSPARGKYSNAYNENKIQGIYAITDPDDKIIIYIGKTNDGTKENGIADRLLVHSKNSYELNRYRSANSILDEYNVRTIEVKDSYFRGYAELYGIAVFSPKANIVSKKQIKNKLKSIN